MSTELFVSRVLRSYLRSYCQEIFWSTKYYMVFLKRSRITCDIFVFVCAYSSAARVPKFETKGKERKGKTLRSSKTDVLINNVMLPFHFIYLI